MPKNIEKLSTAFSKLSWSNLAAQFSEQIALAATPLIAVIYLGADAATTGLLLTIQTLPFLLLSIPAGVYADRSSRKRLMVIAEALRTLALGGIFAGLLTGQLNLYSLAILGFFVATGTVVYSVAAPGLVQSLIPRASLARANRWLELSRSAAFAVGPAIGGILVEMTGAPTAYILAAMLSFWAVMLLNRLPEVVNIVPVKKNIYAELKEGINMIIDHSLLRPILITSIFFNISWFILLAVYVPYAINKLAMSAGEVGITMGTLGAGMVIGALAASKIADKISFGRQIVTGPLCGLLGAAMIFITLLLPLKIFAYLSMFLFGMGPILWTITTMTLRQAVTPQAMIGKVSALIMTVSFGSRPIGAAIGAAIAAQSGINTCLLVVLVGFFIQFVIIMGSAVPKLVVLPR